MSGKRKSISGMKGMNAITDALVNTALGTVGYIGSQKLGAMMPSTVNTNIVNGGKVVLGILAVAYSPKSVQKYLAPVGVGLATEGAIQLVKTYMPSLGIAGIRGGYPGQGPGVGRQFTAGLGRQFTAGLGVPYPQAAGNVNIRATEGVQKTMRG